MFHMWNLSLRKVYEKEMENSSKCSHNHTFWQNTLHEQKRRDQELTLLGESKVYIMCQQTLHGYQERVVNYVSDVMEDNIQFQ